MAVSETSICNLALQKLGARPIQSLNDQSVNAQACALCYEAMRDRELRAYPWAFMRTRALLAPMTEAPAFEYLYAFALPFDFMNVLPETVEGSDWKFEQLNGVRVLLTNESNSVEFSYGARITNPTVFDPMFVEALSSKIAWHLCETLTQSNEKKQEIAAQYRMLISEARRRNAIEAGFVDPPADEWDVARLTGSGINNTIKFFPV